MKTTLEERFTAALRYSGITQSAVARACGISHTAVYRWATGRSKEMSAPNAAAAARVLGVNAEWLATGNGDMFSGTVTASGASLPGEGCVMVPEYRAEESAGGLLLVQREDKLPACYDEAWLESIHVAPADCRLLRVSGDSMRPILYDGDRVLVDCTPDQPIVPGKVYAFWYAGHLQIRRLQPRMDGSMSALSENPAFQPETIPAEDMQQFRLIGRVIDRSGPSPF